MSAKDVIEYVKQQEPKFKELNKANGNLVDFGRECLFARQQILGSEYTLKAAMNDPNSLQAAILNVASIGISLNPASSHAYLVPRAGKICLDISYRGLVYLATDAGAIKWAKSELVYANDEFEWRGPSTVPVHKADPFAEPADRGELRGGYVIAKLPDGETLVETMSAHEINKVRATSSAANGPWKTWFEEMAKKTLIKRAYKSWPQTPARRRLDTAVETLHESEGMAFTIEQQSRYMELLKSGEALDFYLHRLEVGDEAWSAMFNAFPKGEKTKTKDAARKLEQEGHEHYRIIDVDLQSMVDAEEAHGVREIIDELTPEQRKHFAEHFPDWDKAMRLYETTEAA